MKRAVPDSLQGLLRAARIIPDLTDLLAAGQRCYLVGGALRNAWLGLPVADFDFALAGDPTGLAGAFAARVGGHWFSLDEVRAQSRVVVKTESGPVSYDFAPWRAATIDEDLRLRDYTINAQALPLMRGDRSLRELIDPLCGHDDLKNRLLRCCSATVLHDDPLRVLKGVRHCLILGLHPDPKTFGEMAEAASSLRHSAPERVRAELGQIFAGPVEEERFDLFGRLGLPAVLFGAPVASGSFAAGCDAMRRAKGLLQHLVGLDRKGDVVGLFDDIVEQDWPRRALLLLAAFLTGYGVRDVETLARRRLRLGRRATALLKGLTDLAPRRYHEIDHLPPTSRGRALWVDSLGPGRGESLALLLALAATDPHSEGPRLLGLLSDYLNVVDSQGRIPDLVSGDWLRDELGVEDGPGIGELLRRLRDAEVDGRVTGAEDARRFLRQNKH